MRGALMLKLVFFVLLHYHITSLGWLSM